MQVSIHHALAVVVVNLSVVEPCVPDSEIKDAGITVLPAAFGLGQVIGTVCVDKHPNYRMVHGHVIHIPGLAHQRHDANTDMEMIDPQQRRSGIRLGSIHHHLVEIEAGRDAVETKRVIAGPYLRAERGSNLLLRGSQYILMKGTIVQQHVNGE